MPQLFQVIFNLETKVSANKWFLPLTWAMDIIARALAEGNIRYWLVLAHQNKKGTKIMRKEWLTVIM